MVMKIAIRIIVFLFFSIIFFTSNVLSLNSVAQNHSNLISVSSILCGFLFSSLAMLSGVFTSKPIFEVEEGVPKINYVLDSTIVKYEKLDLFDPLFHRIYCGISYGILTLILAILNQFIVLKSADFEMTLYLIWKYSMNCEVTAILLCTFYFMSSVLGIKDLLSEMRSTARSGITTKEDVASIFQNTKIES